MSNTTPAGLPGSGEVMAQALADATPQIKEAWLDKIPAAYRHFLIMGLAYGLSDAAAALPKLHLNHYEAGAAGLVLTFLTEYFTPLTRQFGIGK